MKKLYVLLIFFSLLIVSGVKAQTIRYVKANASGDGSSWATASGDLQAMINASAVNDEVWVAAGVYKPTELIAATQTNSSPTTNRDKSFILRAGVKVFGGFTGSETAQNQRNYTLNETILSGDLGTVGDKSDNAYHVIATRNDATDATLDGFSIQDGNANGTGSVNFSGTLTVPQNSGGAIAFRGAANNVNFTNLIIKNNSCTVQGAAAYMYVSKVSGSGTGIFPFVNVSFVNNVNSGSNTVGLGGAVYITTSSGNVIVSFTDCSFSGNKAGAAGGAIYSLSSGTTLQITNTKFLDNTASGGSGGGAIYFTSGNLLVSGSTFQRNKTTVGSSGAIYLGSAISSRPTTIERSLFEANESNTVGGAIALAAAGVSVNNNKFVANKATLSGGGVYISGTGSKLTGNVFYANEALGTSATDGGGAIFLANASSSTIVNATFYKNSAKNLGGATYLSNSSSSTLNIYNSVFSANTAVVGNAEVFKGADAILAVGSSSFEAFGNNGADGNMVGVAPDFESVNAADAKFLQLTPESLLINAGNNDYIPTGVSVDVLGNDRIANSVVDIGAYEYNGPLPPPLTVYIDENSAAGTFIGKVITKLPGTVTWSIFSGNSSNAFKINAQGEITVDNSSALDYETKNFFSLAVRAVNSVNQFQNILVLVYLNNLMEDPQAPVIVNNKVNDVITSYKPKLVGKAEASSTITIYVDNVAYPVTTSSDAQGNWKFDFENEITPGFHTFHIVANNNLGTSNPSPKVSALFKLYSGNVIANNILTPNGDGKNDFWIVTDLQIMYPKNEVLVYDKLGKVVFKKANYQNDWDGSFNGTTLNTGTYYYEINIGAGLPPVKGTITILKGR